MMCDIWKNRVRNELGPEEYAKIAPSTREVNVTGGEPFLRADLASLIEVLRQVLPSCRILISTNGFLPDVVAKRLEQLGPGRSDLAVRVSIDGIGPVHDAIRGVPGGFERALRTLDVCRAAGIKDLGIAFTATKGTETELERVFDLAETLGVDFALSLPASSPIYFGMRDQTAVNVTALCEAIRRVAARMLRKRPGKAWLRAFFMMTQEYYLRRRVRPVPCTAGRDFYYLDSTGNLHGCHMLDTVMIGSLRQLTFDELWLSERARRVRESSAACNACWMMCTAKTAAPKLLGLCGSWLLVNLIRARLGGSVGVLDPYLSAKRVGYGQGDNPIVLTEVRRSR
jgi:MoaA/NifB/PqqE/SkfB family radical SAM enzyme